MKYFGFMLSTRSVIRSIICFIHLPMVYDSNSWQSSALRCSNILSPNSPHIKQILASFIWLMLCPLMFFISWTHLITYHIFDNNHLFCRRAISRKKEWQFKFQLQVCFVAPNAKARLQFAIKTCLLLLLLCLLYKVCNLNL